ncbi:MAG: HAMP domain-containing histidine kinase [Clostridia bacterium]|nr:HAMP domain-containing histidine kinase [Clostridia bacterium]
MARQADELYKREINGQRLKMINSRNKNIANQLAVLGHEIKSPLTRIVALSEFLLKEIPGKLNDEQKECLQDIYNNSYILMNSINSLLSLSKSEAGYQCLNLSPQNINEVVESVVLKVDSIVSSKGLLMVVDVPHEVPVVNFDREKIEQILFNLLDNAIKFTQNGRIAIKVRVDNEQDQLVVSVEDTGVGIEEKNKDKVFEKFFTKRDALNPGGSGLGLAVVKCFVELHGGKVWLESAVGKGTRVSFTIPIRQAPKRRGCASYACSGR